MTIKSLGKCLYIVTLTKNRRANLQFGNTVLHEIQGQKRTDI